MIIEIGIELPIEALSDLVAEIEDRLDECLHTMAWDGLIENYDMEVKSL